MPAGPQVKVFGEEGRDWPIVACHNGHDAFLVAVSNTKQQSVNILRVSREGELIRRAVIGETFDYWMPGPSIGAYNGTFMQVAGDKVIVAFTDGGPFYNEQRAGMLVGAEKAERGVHLYRTAQGRPEELLSHRDDLRHRGIHRHDRATGQIRFRRIQEGPSAQDRFLKITGKGVRLRNLPPVGCELVKIKDSKLQLKITASGPGGRRPKKIVLEP